MIQTTENFSSETTDTRRKWKYKVLGKTNDQPGFLCSMKISFINDGEIKTFSDEGKLAA